MRGRDNAPMEYANTIANKANCLLNLPDDPENPGAGNPRHIAQAIKNFREASELFTALGAHDRAAATGELVQDLEAEIRSGLSRANGGI